MVSIIPKFFNNSDKLLVRENFTLTPSFQTDIVLSYTPLVESLRVFIEGLEKINVSKVSPFPSSDSDNHDYQVLGGNTISWTSFVVHPTKETPVSIFYQTNDDIMIPHLTKTEFLTTTGILNSYDLQGVLFSNLEEVYIEGILKTPGSSGDSSDYHMTGNTVHFHYEIPIGTFLTFRYVVDNS